MKNIKKISALVLALILVLSLTATAFAADADKENGDTASDGIAGNTSGTWAAPDEPEAQGNTVTIYKEILVDNPETVTVNAPTITYTYTIEAGEANKSIYDAKANHDPEANAGALTKAGVGTPAITTAIDGKTFTTAGDTDANKLIFTPAIQMKAGDDGVTNTYPIHITFAPTAFTGAGVYRYKITEDASTYDDNGVNEGTTGHIRYLDVYVKDATTAGQYEIYGYVCFNYNNNIDARESAADADAVSEAYKNKGFVAGTDTSTANAGAKTADWYNTYNVTITKDLVNDQAMNGHAFPFIVGFANTQVTANVLPIVSGDASVKPTLTAGNLNAFVVDGTSSTTAQQLKIEDGKSVTFTGIPVGTTLTINEKNDVTGTVYTTVTDGATVNEEDGITLNWNTVTNAVDDWADQDDGTGEVTALQKNANDKTVAADENMTVTFTNTLLTISPTGVAFRVAPYVLMLAVGIVFFVLMRRRREEAEEA